MRLGRIMLNNPASSLLLSMPTANANVSTLLVPMETGHLILPENMVAEFIALQDVVYHAHGLAWINLHGVAVPLLSLYQLCPDGSTQDASMFAESSTDNASMALVLHTLLSPELLPLLALRVTGSPHQVEVNAETLREDHKQDGKACAYIASHVRVANLPCVILDLPAIEQSLLKMMSFSNSE